MRSAAPTEELLRVAFADAQAMADLPRYRILYEAVRRAILSQQLVAGARLPSTRELARDLGVSRNTVLSTFEALLAEGYLVARTGSGTFVAHAAAAPKGRGRRPADVARAASGAARSGPEALSTNSAKTFGTAKREALVGQLLFARLLLRHQVLLLGFGLLEPLVEIIIQPLLR